MDYVNGYLIVASLLTPGGHGTRPGRVIVGRNDAGQFVTAWQGQYVLRDGVAEYDRSWNNGSYTSDAAAAIADAVARHAGVAGSDGFLVDDGCYLCCDHGHTGGVRCLVYDGVVCRKCRRVAAGGGWRQLTAVEEVSASVE